MTNKCRHWEATGTVRHLPASREEPAEYILDAYCDECGYHFTDWGELGKETQVEDEETGVVIEFRSIYPMKCNQCVMLSINGLATHELGCPNQNKDWNEEFGEWEEREYPLDEFEEMEDE